MEPPLPGARSHGVQRDLSYLVREQPRYLLLKTLALIGIAHSPLLAITSSTNAASNSRSSAGLSATISRTTSRARRWGRASRGASTFAALRRGSTITRSAPASSQRLRTQETASSLASGGGSTRTNAP